jgi:hypothetical protein
MAKVRVKKREVVIPFEGEEMFVVPKRKGFGQPDMEGYVMATGGRTTGLETDTSNPTLDTNTNTTSGGTSTIFQTGNTGIGIATGSSADVPNPRGTISVSSSSDGAGTIGGGIAVGSGTNAGDVPTGNQTQTGTTTIISASPLPETGINSPIQTGAGSGGQIEVGNMGAGQQTDTGSGTNTDIEIPLFPNLSTMNCTELKSEIKRLSDKIATNVFPIIVANAYNNQITLAKGIESTKCTRVLPNEPLIITPPAPIIAPPIGGGIFGGGGGFGEPPIDEVAPIEEKKNNMGIYLIVGGIALLYFLTRKKKS